VTLTEFEQVNRSRGAERFVVAGLAYRLRRRVEAGEDFATVRDELLRLRGVAVPLNNAPSLRSDWGTLSGL
jgi:hypothetical protein